MYVYELNHTLLSLLVKNIFHFVVHINNLDTMFSKDDARTVVGIIGNMTALILFSSPMPTIYDIWKKKSVEQYSPIPYLAIFINCGLWVLYGLPMVHPHSTLVVTVNGSGFVIAIGYISVFMLYTDPKTRKRILGLVVAEILFLAVLAMFVVTLAQTTKLRSAIVGSICIVGSIMVYVSPLSVMKLVIQTKSVEYMPFFLSLFSFLNGVAWTAYALIQFDPFVVTPNGMGAVFGLAQLVLYTTYYKSTKKIMAERKEKGELALTRKSASTVDKTGNV